MARCIIGQPNIWKQPISSGSGTPHRWVANKCCLGNGQHLCTRFVMQQDSKRSAVPCKHVPTPSRGAFACPEHMTVSAPERLGRNRFVKMCSGWVGRRIALEAPAVGEGRLHADAAPARAKGGADQRHTDEYIRATQVQGCGRTVIDRLRSNSEPTRRSKNRQNTQQQDEISQALSLQEAVHIEHTICVFRIAYILLGIIGQTTQHRRNTQPAYSLARRSTRENHRPQQ